MTLNCGEFLQNTLSNFDGRLLGFRILDCSWDSEFLQHTLCNSDDELW